MEKRQISKDKLPDIKFEDAPKWIASLYSDEDK